MGRVFKSILFEEGCSDFDVRYIRGYHIYRVNGARNSQFSQEDRMILDLKNREEEAVQFFAVELQRMLAEDIAICVVPPHHRESVNDSGIADVARIVAAKGRRIDCVDLLRREKEIKQLSGGGKRGKTVHYESVAVNPIFSVEGKTVLLLDDVVTTGGSLVACRNIIMENTGAKRCVMLALAKTLKPGAELRYEFLKKKRVLEVKDRLSAADRRMILVGCPWMVKDVLGGDVGVDEGGVAAREMAVGRSEDPSSFPTVTSLGMTKDAAEGSLGMTRGTADGSVGMTGQAAIEMKNDTVGISPIVASLGLENVSMVAEDVVSPFGCKEEKDNDNNAGVGTKSEWAWNLSYPGGERRYYVYILANWNNRVLYVGVTNNIVRRVYEHRTGAVDGFTKKYNVYKLVHMEEFGSIEDAIRREKQIKGFRREKKLALVNQGNVEWKDLMEG